MIGKLEFDCRAQFIRQVAEELKKTIVIGKRRVLGVLLPSLANELQYLVVAWWACTGD